MTPHSERRLLARNPGSVFGAHAAGIVATLVTVPWLARVLRPEGWAPVIVAQALAAWLVVMLEFGFDLSGTRDVARARANPGTMRRVVLGVQSAKAFLLLPTVLVFAGALAWLPTLRADGALAGSALAVAALRGLSPLWYFQGIERLPRAVAVESGASIVAALSVFAFVRGPADGWRVLALQAACSGVSLVILTRWLTRDVPFGAPSFAAALETVRSARTVFGFRLAAGLYVQANSIILATLAAPATVAFFGGAERLIRAAINLYQPMTRAILPRVSYLQAGNPESARRTVTRLLVVMFATGVVLAAGAWLGAPLLVRTLLGAGYEPAIPLLRALAPLPIVVAIGTVLGIWWALPAGHERAFLRIVVAAGALNVALAVTLVPRMGGTGMAVAVLCAETFVALALAVLFVRRRGAGDPEPDPARDVAAAIHEAAA